MGYASDELSAELRDTDNSSITKDRRKAVRLTKFNVRFSFGVLSASTPPGQVRPLTLPTESFGIVSEVVID